MGFRENLKLELDFKGMTVKELATASGVHQRAITNYLRTHEPALPVADAAVKIARALGVTVEYLVTGDDRPVSGELQQITRNLRRVSPRDRRLVCGLLESMIDRAD
jgi:transcriptional regulator with XRE-family HTH domain